MKNCHIVLVISFLTLFFGFVAEAQKKIEKKKNGSLNQLEQLNFNQENIFEQQLKATEQLNMQMEAQAIVLEKQAFEVEKLIEQGVQHLAQMEVETAKNLSFETETLAMLNEKVLKEITLETEALLKAETENINAKIGEIFVQNQSIELGNAKLDAKFNKAMKWFFNEMKKDKLIEDIGGEHKIFIDEETFKVNKTVLNDDLRKKYWLELEKLLEAQFDATSSFSFSGEVYEDFDGHIRMIGSQSMNFSYRNGK